MSRELPATPNLENLKKQAKYLLQALQEGDATTAELFRSLPLSAEKDSPKFADAQQAIAREYGFASWTKLKEHVDSVRLARKPAEKLSAAVRASDGAEVGRVLESHRELKEQINGPLANVAAGVTPLLAAVQRADRETIEALLQAGADINARSRWWCGGRSVLDECAPELAEFLMERGASLDAHGAARLGMLEKLRELVEADPDVLRRRAEVSIAV